MLDLAQPGELAGGTRRATRAGEAEEARGATGGLTGVGSRVVDAQAVSWAVLALGCT